MVFSNTIDETAPAAGFYRRAVLVLFFLLTCRLLAMYIVPLNDNAEARYGEIARIMLETGNWVTPMHTYGEPFWAKPPLSIWLSAFSMKLFGVNELAVRLPGLVSSIGVLWLTWSLARRRSGSIVAMTATLVLAGGFFFFVNSGTAMTDPSLVFCTTLTLVAFWQAIVNQSKTWGYLFFVGLGLGLLAKGPVALVVTAMPLLIWVLRRKEWLALWQRLPWLTGSLLLLAIAIPWYVLAEMRTPGFLNYFIAGEHFGRFLQSGWAGDRYGLAHAAPYGMIWVYTLVGTIPWSIAGLIWLTRHAKVLPTLCRDDDGWISYLVLCTVTPLVFFTVASNIAFTYVYPSLPTFALLFAELSNRARLTPRAKKGLVYCASISGFAFLLITSACIYVPEFVAPCQNRVVRAYKNQSPSPESNLVYWGRKTAYSAQFYSAGKAKATLDSDALFQLLTSKVENYVVIDSRESTPLPNNIGVHLTEVARIPGWRRRNFTVFRSGPLNELQLRFPAKNTISNGYETLNEPPPPAGDMD